MSTNSTAILLCPRYQCCRSRRKCGLIGPATVLASLLVFLAPASLRAQDTPRIQGFAGYSYMRFQSPTLGFARDTGLNGLTLMAAGNLFRNFGVVVEASGEYDSHLEVKDIAFGPQLLWPKGRMLFFAHGLFGRVRSVDKIGTTTRDTGNTFEGGGGVDMELSRRFSIRIVQADYLHTSLFQHTQNNLRFSTGLVYHWGALHRKARRPPSEPTP
jgi:hypothetical protein